MGLLIWLGFVNRDLWIVFMLLFEIGHKRADNYFSFCLIDDVLYFWTEAKLFGSTAAARISGDGIVESSLLTLHIVSTTHQRIFVIQSNAINRSVKSSSRWVSDSFTVYTNFWRKGIVKCHTRSVVDAPTEKWCWHKLTAAWKCKLIWSICKREVVIENIKLSWKQRDQSRYFAFSVCCHKWQVWCTRTAIIVTYSYFIFTLFRVCCIDALFVKPAEILLSWPFA